MAGSLTLREQEVLELISSGLTVGATADRLNVTRDTIKAHLKNIYRKLNVHTRVGLLRSIHSERVQPEPSRTIGVFRTPSRKRTLIVTAASMVVIGALAIFLINSLGDRALNCGDVAIANNTRALAVITDLSASGDRRSERLAAHPDGSSELAIMGCEVHNTGD